MASKVTLLHYNDVYNIEGQKDEPSGGAARMKTYIDSQKDVDPLVFFSGDALNPSLSMYTNLRYCFYLCLIQTIY